MSLVTVIKDYFEIVHKIIETSPAYIVQHTTYTDFTTLYFYLINTFKNIFTDFFSLDFLQRLTSFPIIVPNITDSMISEISVLDGNFHNLFTFLDSPIFEIKNDSIVTVCLEKFFVGFLNSLFLWLPTSAATFLCLRRFVMQGMEIGYIAAIGTMTANVFWLICVLFGIRCIVIPWMSLDILRYWLGFILLIKYFWDNRLPAKEIKSDISSNILKSQFGLKSFIAVFAQIFQFNKNNPIKQIFFFHFLLAFTEQTTVYPFISNFSFSAQSTYLESFSSNNFSSFLIIHCFYLLGIFIGSFSLINFVCWFWEEPAYKVYLWTTKNFQKIRVGEMVRITHFIFQTLTIILACASLPYFSIEYFVTKPLGFLPNDQLFHESQNSAFLTHSTSPILYRSPYFFPRQRFFRYDDWAEYYGKNLPLDTSLYDQGAYRLYPIEDLHFGADYEWTRRRSNHVKIRSRMKRIMWFPRNWATQIWDLAKTWSRRNVAWRNEILSQYQNNWDSKSAPFWEQIVREDLLLGTEKLTNETKTKSPWVASPNWSQKFLISGESFWWNWWSKNTNSDNKIWWNWILTKKNQIILNNNNQLNSYEHNSVPRSASINIKEKNNQSVLFNEALNKQDLFFSNYQKLPSSSRLDYWLPQERLLSLYSEQSERQKNQLVYEMATLRKLVRKIKKRVQINLNLENNPSRFYNIFSLKNGESYYNKFIFSKNLKLLINNLNNPFFANRSFLLNNTKNQLDLEPTNQNLIYKNPTNTLSNKNNLFSNPSQGTNASFSSFFLTLPAEYYLQTEQSFSRKLQFYGVRTSREFKSLNNAPLFNYYMKTYFHQYKPTRLYIATTKMKRDLGAGGRNRFKSRQYANKQLKKARILSKTPWIRQWISQSGFLTRRKRLESWIRYSHYTSNEIWGFILRTDIDSFIKRQPNNHVLTNNEERLLHLRRFLLGEHFETLRWYCFMQHYRSMKAKIGGTKSFVNRIYNQQFKGTFHKVRHLFALTPSLNGGGLLTFDQLLYNEFLNDNKNSIFNQELIHEELLSENKRNINLFLVKDKKTENLYFNLNSNDFIINFSDIIKNYLLTTITHRQEAIQKLVKDKNFVDLTILLQSASNNTEFNKNFLINQISKIDNDKQDQKQSFTNQQRILYLLKIKDKSKLPAVSIDEQKKFQSMLIFLFNKRRFLAKDYKRGSERLWKNWRKKYLIQKQIQKQNKISKLVKSENLIFSDNVYKNLHPIENQSLPIYRTNNNRDRSDFESLYYKNFLKTNENNSGQLSYQKQSTIRKALRDSILIQNDFFNKNLLETKTKNTDFPLIINNLNQKLESQNKITEKINKNVNTILDVRKKHFQSKLLNTDKNVINELIHKKYKKIQIFNIFQLKYFTFDYWLKNRIFKNVNKKAWNLLSANKNNNNLDTVLKNKNALDNNSILNKTKKEKEILNILSYIQNKTIRQRLDINKQILNLRNYNQTDSKFLIVRASRHLKRARISQRKKLSQPIQKYKNFFHIEKENLKKLNIFQTYKTFDSSVLNIFKNLKLEEKRSKKNQHLQNINSLLNYELNYKNSNNNVSEFYNNEKLFNVFQPFVDFFYFLPRFSTLWQSNLINTTIQQKIDMGTIYETKENLPPTGIQKQLFRQNFNTKNKYQDNIKRKLLDNHLNRFSERRRWNNQYQTLNSEIKEQIKKFLETLKQNQNLVFKNKKTFNTNLLFEKEKIERQDFKYRKEDRFKYLNNKKLEFFSLQKSIANLNLKQIDELSLLSSLIDQKTIRQNQIDFSLLSFFKLNYIFNKFKKNDKDFDYFNSNQPNLFDFWNQAISYSNNSEYSNIKELIINNDLNKKVIPHFNKQFLNTTELNNIILNYYPDIKKDKITQKKLFLIILRNLQTTKSKKIIYYRAKRNSKTSKDSQNVKYYLIKNVTNKIEKQLQKLEDKLQKVMTINNQKEQQEISITQKQLITKRIQFLTKLNLKLKALHLDTDFSPAFSIDGKIKKIENLTDVSDFFYFKDNKKQYYLSKKSLNLLVNNCENLMQYLNLKKEINLKKQNFSELLKSQFSEMSDAEIKTKTTKSEIPYSMKNSIELKKNARINKLLKKPIMQNIIKVQSNSKQFFQLDEKGAKIEKPENNLIPNFSVDSSILKYLLKKQKLTNYEETVGSIVAIQKRGTEHSQKNIYYKKYKNKWNKNKSNLFSQFIADEDNGMSNFIGIRTWNRAKQHFNDTSTSRQKKLINLQDSSSIFSSNIFSKQRTPDKFLSIETFIKESILKPQRFEKQQSRKRLKFKKLPRQERFKNLQFWDNFFKQREDIKNKLFFDDLSLSFQKWKNFGFFQQKKMHQKQINNFYIFLSQNKIPSNTKRIFNEDNKKSIKFSNFYDTNVKTITNLEIIKQIEYDNLIQKELNIFLNNEIHKTNINSTIFNNKALLERKNIQNIESITNNDNLNSSSYFYNLDSENNQEQINNSNKDVIGTIYEKLFIQPIQSKTNEIKINNKLLIGINTFPFYAGWDESLRKFVITNRLLSRREAGYNTKLGFKDQQKNSNNLNIEFQKWPLQGRNAATSFFCHFPFITQPTDFYDNLQYKNRTEFQQEELSSLTESKDEPFSISNKSVNQSFALKRIKKQKQEFRNENRRNITNIVGLNEMQSRRNTIFFPLKWRDLKYNTNKIILKLPWNKLESDLSLSNYDKQINNLSSNSVLFKEKNIGPMLSKFHLLRILRKGNTSKLRLTKLKQYKKYIKRENDIVESSWRIFLSKRKLRSYNFVRQKNIKTMHFLKYEIGKRLQTTKLQWLFRKNNSRGNRQSENRKNKSGLHYLRPRKKSLRKRSLGIKYKQNQSIFRFNNFDTNKLNLSKIRQKDVYTSQINLNENPVEMQKKMLPLSIKESYKTNLHKLNSLIITERASDRENQIKFFETPLNWIGPKNSNNIYHSLFKIPSIYTPTLYSILPGHARFLPKMQTMPLPKSSVQTIKRAVRLANFESASFIQREVLSYEWSMKQLIHNMNSRLNHSVNRLMLKNNNTNSNKNYKFLVGSDSSSVDFIIQRHLHLFKKKIINNPTLNYSNNSFLSQFSRQRSFQKRSIRLRKFNMTLAMNLYDRWFFYYYTGGREDPLQNLFQNFGKLAKNISNTNNTQFNQPEVSDNTRTSLDSVDKFKKDLIFKSIRKFLTQKPDQKRSFNTFLTNLKTKKSSSNKLEVSNQQDKQNIFNSTNLNQNDVKNENSKNQTPHNSNSSADSIDQWWHLFKLFPEKMNEPLLEKQKELLVKNAANKKQKKQQEKDLEEDRFYFLKANKSPIIQDFRSSQSVNRHYPLNGGLIWPGDYLRLQTIMLPKEKKYKYFYNKNLLPEIQNAGELKNKNLQTSTSMIDSNYKINQKIKEFQNYILESK